MAKKNKRSGGKKKRKGRRMSWQEKVRRWPRTKCSCGRTRANHHVRHPFRAAVKSKRGYRRSKSRR